MALLRGINLGGHHKVPMAELRRLLEESGLSDVSTYLQSGNAAFDSAEEPDVVRRRIEAEVAERFGFEVAVVIRSRTQLDQVVADNPFPEAAADDPKKVHAFFLVDEPDADTWERFDANAFAPEELGVGDDVVYVHTPGGLGRAKLPDQVVRRLHPVEVTARNWRTVLKLVEMAEG